MKAPRFDQSTAWILAIVLAGSVAGLFYLLQDWGARQAREDGESATTQTQRNKDKRRTFFEWDYVGARGPRHWANLHERFVRCGTGKRQSPVDISSWQIDRRLLPIKPSYKRMSVSVQFDGRLAQVRPEGEEGAVSTLQADAKNWRFDKLLLRSPSEHHVKGIPYDAELQFFHRDAADRIIVLSVFVEATAETKLEQRRAIADLIDALKTSDDGDVAIPYDLDLASLVPEDLQFMQYDGSSTFPPCQEGVRWLLLTTPLRWPEQALRDLRQVLRHNVRGLQRRDMRVSASSR